METNKQKLDQGEIIRTNAFEGRGSLYEVSKCDFTERYELFSVVSREGLPEYKHRMLYNKSFSVFKKKAARYFGIEI